MSAWDIFHADRLELVRDLDPEAVRRGLADGSLRDDDLARPSRSGAPWVRLGDLPDFLAPSPAPVVEPEPEPVVIEPEPPAPTAPLPPRPPVPETVADIPTFTGAAPPDSDFQDLFADDSLSGIDLGLGPAAASSHSARGDEHDIPVLLPDDDDEVLHAEPDTPVAPLPAALAHPPAPSLELPAPQPPQPEPGGEDTEEDEDEDEDEHSSLSSAAHGEMEDLDLTAMADIAMQMIMFLLVAATVVYFKTLEIPNPSPEEGQGAVSQSMLTPEELSDTYILVEIDPQGRILIDQEPAEPAALVDRLRAAREETLRTQMLLNADFQTPHANTVYALDAAAEIGLAITLARPPSPTP